MKKALIQLFLVVSAIALVFFLLSRVDWVSKLGIKNLPSINEAKIEKYL